VEAPITPICRRLLAAALAGSLLLCAGVASANVDEEAALQAYVRAEGADAVGTLDEASAAFAAALRAAPDNEILAAGALRQALVAGDRGLALTAARSLERAGRVAPDARLVLLADALIGRKWRPALLHVEAIEKDEIFSFMAPVLRAWIAHGSGKGDPLAILHGAAAHPLAGIYAAEHRALLLVASGEGRQGSAELVTATAAPGVHAQRLRIAAASWLARKGERERALALLEPGLAPFDAARRQIVAGKRSRGEVTTAAAGTAELLIRIAADLSGQELPELALSFARLGTFLAPDNSEAWLVTAELLGARGRHDAALAALGRIPVNDPFESVAAENRITLLAAAGRSGEALALAEAAAAADGAGVEEWVRLGGLRSEAKQAAPAAEAYARALALAQPRPLAARPEWTLWLLHGSALVEAGDWAKGKAALERAYKLAPDQAVVLNYLGYSQLERRENMDEAERLIREASRLQPDDAAITDSLGWALYLRGKYGEAIATLERAAQSEPGDAAISEHLGDAYYSAGRRYEARYAWSAALLSAQGAAAARLRAKLDLGLTPELAAP